MSRGLLPQLDALCNRQARAAREDARAWGKSKGMDVVLGLFWLRPFLRDFSD